MAVLPRSCGGTSGQGRHRGGAGHSGMTCTGSSDYSGHPNIVSRRAFIFIDMARDAAMNRLTAARVLIILGVLVSLCVSDNVGPRLLPLPSLAELPSAPGVFDPWRAASRAPSHGRTERARVEMVTAPQSRVGAERQSPHAAAAPKFELAVPPAPRTLRREPYPPSAERSVPFARPLGRAPPRLV